MGWTDQALIISSVTRFVGPGQIIGNNYIIDAQGVKQYAGTPAAGNAIQSLVPQQVTDGFGNTFAGGIQTQFITANGQTFNANQSNFLRSGSGVTGTGGTSFTGLIMSPGTYAGQVIQIINISATANLTFAAAVTSNVAGGTANVLSPIAAAGFVWSPLDGLWYGL